MNDTVIDTLLAEQDAIITRLSELVAQPSVSTDPAYAEGMAGARELLLARLTTAGFQDVQTLSAGGYPALFAQHCQAPGRPTLLVYGHYDVQPPDPLERWDSPPFTVTVRDGRLYGRGISDDKGPLSIAVEALSGLLAQEGHLPVNVKLLIEGEEEVGSATLGNICRQHRQLLAADAVLSADGARWRADLPTMTVGCRGNVGFQVNLVAASKDLHSGRYGGGVANALHLLTRLLDGLHDERGRVTVAGFYDDVAEPAPAERTRLAALPFDAAGFIAGLAAIPGGELDYGLLERLWLRPTLELNGLWGGYTGPGAKTVIPCEAHAKLTARLVPGQQPESIRQAIQAHLRERCPRGVRLSFDDNHSGAAAYTVPGEHPLLTAAEGVLHEVLGSAPQRVRMGSTLPLASLVRDSLGLDTVMFSFSTADEDFHAPNEFLRLSAIPEGLTCWVRLLRQLGEQEASTYQAFQHPVAE